MWYLLRITNGYYYTIITSTKRLDTYGGNPPKLLSPASAISSAPARSSALVRPSERKPLSELEIPGSDLPDSGIHPARFLWTPLAFPWLFPNGWLHVYPEGAGIPELEGGCYFSLRSSGDISFSHSGVSRSHRNVPMLSVNHYTITADSSGLRGLPNRTPL